MDRPPKRPWSDPAFSLRMGNIQDGSLGADLKYLPSITQSSRSAIAGDLLFNRTNGARWLVNLLSIGAISTVLYASARCRPIHLRIRFSMSVASQFGPRQGVVASVVSQQVGQANVNGTKLQRLAFPLPQVRSNTDNCQVVNGSRCLGEPNTGGALRRSVRLRQAILKQAEGKLVPQIPRRAGQRPS